MEPEKSVIGLPLNGGTTQLWSRVTAVCKWSMDYYNFSWSQLSCSLWKESGSTPYLPPFRHTAEK